MRGLQLEVEYLTVGGSNLLAVVSRYTNLTTRPRHFNAGAVAFVQPGGSREALQSIIERDGSLHCKKPTLYGRDLRSDDWGAVLRPNTDAICMLVAAADRSQIEVEDWGEEGPGLSMSNFVALGPQATIETICYFVLTKGVEKARAYAALKDLKQLP